MISGELDHKPQLPILLALTEEAAREVAPAALKRWMRTAGPHGRPIDLLLAQDYGAFEEALEDLRSRGFVVRGGGQGRAPGGAGPG
mgnify:FL=1